MPYLNQFLFGIYPYIALGVFFLGSLIRFDREQYSWRSGSSQLLRSRQLRWGSNLFHIGVLFLLFGHTVGMLTPHWAYESFMTAGAKQVLAMVSGGIAGALALVGLTILLHRRLADPRIRHTSSSMDILLLLLLWVQLARWWEPARGGVPAQLAGWWEPARGGVPAQQAGWWEPTRGRVGRVARRGD